MPFEIESPDQTLAEKLKALGSDFALSLANQLLAKGSLSEKQTYWANKLLAEADAKQAAAANPQAALWASQVPGVWNAFATSTPAGAKKPAVILAMGEAGAKGALRLSYNNSGKAYIRLQWAPTPKAGWTYCGSVRPNDALKPALGLLKALTEDDLRDTLEAFGDDAAEVLAKTGLAFGICANCGKGLTHPVSVQMGIGPVCIKLFPSLLPKWKATEAALKAKHPLA